MKLPFLEIQTAIVNAIETAGIIDDGAVGEAVLEAVKEGYLLRTRDLTEPDEYWFCPTEAAFAVFWALYPEFKP